MKKKTKERLQHILLTGTALSLSLGVLTHGATFSDIGSHWAKEYIETAYRNGSVSGYEDGSFKPDSNVSYAEVAVMLSNVAYDVSQFVDLQDSHWAANHVKALKSRDSVGAVEMVLSGSEVYGLSATREDVCYLVGGILDDSGRISRSWTEALSTASGYAEEFGISFSTSPYLEYYTEDKIRGQLVGNTMAGGIMTGKPGGDFAKDDPITRGEMAVVLDKLQRFYDVNPIQEKYLTEYTCVPSNGFYDTVNKVFTVPSTFVTLGGGSSTGVLSREFEEVLLRYGLETPNLLGPYEVTRVVDGDTLIVRVDGVDTRVRLIGIDTPESVHPDASENTEEGLVASDYTKSLLPSGSRVYLEMDVEPLDIYDRTLAYVFMEDGRFLNAHLLEVGMAEVMTYPPQCEICVLF